MKYKLHVPFLTENHHDDIQIATRVLHANRSVAAAALAAQSQAIDNAAAYTLANQVADELELVRERMGRPYDDSPRLPVSAVTELELYFQTQSLLRKANQLAQELAGAAPRAAGPVPSGEIDADDVHALLDDALAQIRVAAEAIGITERATFEQRVTSIAATGVFLVVIDVNRQLNHMLSVPISDAEVFEEVSSAITYAASLLSTYPARLPCRSSRRSMATSGRPTSTNASPSAWTR